MKIDEMIRLFMDTRRRGTGGAKRRCTAATMEYYERNLTIFRDLLLKLDEQILDYGRLRRLHIVSVIDTIEANLREGKWSKATTLQFYRVMKTFFRWVDTDEDCQEAGLKGFAKYIPVIEKNPRRDFIPAVTDLRQFRNAFKTHQVYQFRDYVAFCLMLDTGIRVGELCSLKLEDLMLRDRRMIVDGKTGRRLIPLTTAAVKMLAAWLKKREATEMGRKSPYVFTAKYGEQLSVNGIEQSFRKLRKAHGLTNITPHTLRHSFSTYYLRNGGNLERLRNITGHTTYEMLKDYLHMAQVTGDEAMDELDRVAPSNKL